MCCVCICRKRAKCRVWSQQQIYTVQHENAFYLDRYQLLLLLVFAMVILVYYFCFLKAIMHNVQRHRQQCRLFCHICFGLQPEAALMLINDDALIVQQENSYLQLYMTLYLSLCLCSSLNHSHT